MPFSSSSCWASCLQMPLLISPAIPSPRNWRQEQTDYCRSLGDLKDFFNVLTSNLSLAFFSPFFACIYVFFFLHGEECCVFYFQMESKWINKLSYSLTSQGAVTVIDYRWRRDRIFEVFWHKSANNRNRSFRLLMKLGPTL